MKAQSPLTFVVCLLVGAFFLSGNLAQARTVDLSELAGTFKGTLAIQVLGTTIPGTVTVKSKVKSEGRSATIVIIGLIPASTLLPTDLPFGATVELKAPRTAKITNMILGSPTGLPPIKGKFNQKSSTRVTANVSLTNPSGLLTGVLTVQSDIQVKPSGKEKKKVVGTMNFLVDGTPTAVIIINAKGKSK